MVYYHVFLERIKNEKREFLLAYDSSEEFVRDNVATPFRENRAFIFIGKSINPTEVEGINVFYTEKELKNIVVSDGKNAIDYKNIELLGLFNNGEIESATIVTNFFIKPPVKTSNQITPQQTIKEVKTKTKVFIVHGRDEASAFKLKDHLLKKGINAEMFEDFKERITGNTTVIEELIKIKDEISYAFVIASADDLGNLCEEIEDYINGLVKGKTSVEAKDVCGILDKLNFRARQNVLFEYGLFLGVLGRDKVECLWNKKIGEEPSDIKGVVNLHFEKSIRETFPDIDAKIDKIN